MKVATNPPKNVVTRRISFQELKPKMRKTAPRMSVATAKPNHSIAAPSSAAVAGLSSPIAFALIFSFSQSKTLSVTEA